MLGAIIGDLAGSRFEFHPHKSKEFILLDSRCFPTDDTYMTLSIARALLETRAEPQRLGQAAAENMRQLGQAYPDAGYGTRFRAWLQNPAAGPYQSIGNGAAMRVSPCGWAASSLAEARQLAQTVTVVSHDTPSAIRAAQAVSGAIFLGRQGSSRQEIRTYLEDLYGPLNKTLAEIRPGYRFDATCNGSVPQSLLAFLEGTDYVDTVRNAVSLGGDSDTMAAIAGSIAEAVDGIPDLIRQQGLLFLDREMKQIVADSEQVWPPVIPVK